MKKILFKPLFLCALALALPALSGCTSAKPANARTSCPGDLFIEATGTGKTPGEASADAKVKMAEKIISQVKSKTSIGSSSVESGGIFSDTSIYLATSQIESNLTLFGFKDMEPPKRLENGEYEVRGYVCAKDAAKPYLDSLKGINQFVGIQKVNNSFCETLYKTYSPRVMLFERILGYFGEMDESRMASYRKAERECDNMSASIAKGYVGFEEALDKAVAEIASNRGKAQTKIVIAEIYASPDELSNFITDELKSKLAKVRTFAVMQADMNAKSDGQALKMGPMKYDDAIRAGKKADVVLVGRFAPYEKFSYFKLEALDVQPPPKTLAMHTDKIRPDEAELADLISGKPPAITEDALAYLNNGIDLYMKWKDDEAINELSRALAINGNLAEGYYYRGNVYYDKGNYDRAIEDYNAALRIRHDYYEALNNRGNAYREKGDYDRAIENYNAALRIKPDLSEALNNRGLTYYDIGNYDRAMEDYNTALKIKPDYDLALYNRGNAHREKGNFDRAIEDYNAALKIKPDDHEALNNRGFAYAKKGNLDRAIEDYNAALRIKPDYEFALNNRGFAYYSKGNLDRAIEDWKAVLRIDPNNAIAKQNLEEVRQEKAKARK